ncbi:hypothetical protein OUZ56_008461 [Daphnia magna]|uniref:Uncharacterized protein n=1 Tax=Daphnia magna TaxID=35525 RepID=A0ABR0ADE3_9CRUS|nr:hypothetical protein OUZ56_008461 [Daphnia magna]
MGSSARSIKLRTPGPVSGPSYFLPVALQPCNGRTNIPPASPFNNVPLRKSSQTCSDASAHQHFPRFNSLST